MRLLAASALVIALALPAAGDEIEESINAALEAYRAGDIKTAKEEIDYAAQLLAQQKAGSLADLLPAALPGWTRDDVENQAAAAGVFGGTMASATYRRGGETVEIQMMADNPMVTQMAALFGNPAMAGSMGTLKRINRQKVIVTNQGELMTLINNRIMVQVQGSAPVEDKEAYFGAIDLKTLSEF